VSNVTDVPPREISRYMNELVNFINNRGYGKLGLVEQAACVHYRFSQIQPCPNSGVTARLLMNFVLIRSRYPLTVVRWNDRREYFDSLDKRFNILSTVCDKMCNVYFKCLFDKNKRMSYAYRL